MDNESVIVNLEISLESLRELKDIEAKALLLDETEAYLDSQHQNLNSIRQVLGEEKDEVRASLPEKGRGRKVCNPRLCGDTSLMKLHRLYQTPPRTSTRTASPGSYSIGNLRLTGREIRKLLCIDVVWKLVMTAMLLILLYR